MLDRLSAVTLWGLGLKYLQVPLCFSASFRQFGGFTQTSSLFSCELPVIIFEQKHHNTSKCNIIHIKEWEKWGQSNHVWSIISLLDTPYDGESKRWMKVTDAVIHRWAKCYSYRKKIFFSLITRRCCEASEEFKGEVSLVCWSLLWHLMI